MQDSFRENVAEKHRPGLPGSIGLLLATFGSFALLGCGQNYRPVVSAINPVGPAGQPTKYAIVVSSPSATTNGLLTVVDFSGDTILATPEIQPLGVVFSPNYLALPAGGTQAFVVNAQNSLSSALISNPSILLTSTITQTALPVAPVLNNIPSVTALTFGGSARVLLPEISQSEVAVLSAASPTLQQEITVGANPVYVVGADTTPRAYVISNGNGTGQGEADAIEATSLSRTAIIPVGIDPVYGVETTDVRRAFILNKGSGTVSVINVTNNALDNANPTIPATGTLGLNPVWADLSTPTNELVVLNQGDGVHAGSLSIISIPLCNAAAIATNPTCDATNPVDGVGFGTVVATVPVGVNPTMVSVLGDGSRAYVINSGNAATGVEGSVSVVNLASGTVSATIPAVSAPALTTDPSTSPTYVYGHPNSVSATTGSPTGKVYVTSPDSRYLTVIETDTDTVDTHINIQGAGVRVRVNLP